MKYLLVLCSILVLTSCDTMYGVSRTAKISSLPDIELVAKRIQDYPEIDRVKTMESEGARPRNYKGTKRVRKIYYILYEGGKNIRGTIQFTVKPNGDITYRQYIMHFNKKVSPDCIKASLPVMKKIEKDLETIFGVKSLQKNIRVWSSN